MDDMWLGRVVSDFVFQFPDFRLQTSDFGPAS